MLSESKIGHVCLALSRHPEETRENKLRLRALCDQWFRVMHAEASDGTDRQRDMLPTLAARRRPSNEPPPLPESSR